MGTSHSKTKSNPTSTNNVDSTWQFTSKNKEIIYSGWQEICQCSHTDWYRGISDLFGFHRHKFLCNSELHSVCAPGFCSESLSHKLPQNSYRSSSSSKSKKLREHFEYNHIPAMISSLQNYSIHGIANGCSNHGNTVMLLIYSTSLHKTKFIIVDLTLNRYVCALGDDYTGLVDVKKVHAAWSMDRTQVLIRVPMLGGTTVLDFYRVVKKDAKLYRRIIPIDPYVEFQFCPNYWSSRLAFYSNASASEMTLIQYILPTTTTTTHSNSNKIQTQTTVLHQLLVGSYLSLMNIHSWSTDHYQTVPLEPNFRLVSLQYTPDSVYLILLFADKSCHCSPTLSLSYLDIYHSNSLQRVHRIDTQLMIQLCPWHMCRNYFTPIFSRSSARMAYCTTRNNAGKELQVSIIVLPNEINLKSICRRILIDYVHEFRGKIEDITGALPYRLSQYVQCRPEFQ